MANGYQNEHIEIEHDGVVREVEKSWLVDFGFHEVWLPKSECYLDEERNLAGVPRWLAKKEGLTEE